jgi:hypothetical protein
VGGVATVVEPRDNAHNVFFLPLGGDTEHSFVCRSVSFHSQIGMTFGNLGGQGSKLIEDAQKKIFAAGTGRCWIVHGQIDKVGV